jgi:hypothetical protein
VLTARRNVADRYKQVYQINAILAGDWDSGFLIQDEIEKLLKSPPLSDGDES